jgi:hypothetical protein
VLRNDSLLALTKLSIVRLSGFHAHHKAHGGSKTAIIMLHGPIKGLSN